MHKQSDWKSQRYRKQRMGDFQVVIRAESDLPSFSGAPHCFSQDREAYLNVFIKKFRET